MREKRSIPESPSTPPVPSEVTQIWNPPVPSRRVEIAMHVLAGLLSRRDHLPEVAAALALEHADALLKANAAPVEPLG